MSVPCSDTYVQVCPILSRWSGFQMLPRCRRLAVLFHLETWPPGSSSRCLVYSTAVHHDHVVMSYTMLTHRGTGRLAGYRRLSMKIKEILYLRIYLEYLDTYDWPGKRHGIYRDILLANRIRTIQVSSSSGVSFQTKGFRHCSGIVVAREVGGCWLNKDSFNI